MSSPLFGAWKLALLWRPKSVDFRFHISTHFLYLFGRQVCVFCIKSYAISPHHRPLNSIKFSHCFSDPSVPSVCSVILGQIAAGMFFRTCVLACPSCSQSTISGQALDSGHLTRLFRLWCGDLLPVCVRVGFGLIYKLLTHDAFAPLPDCWNGYSMCWW